MPHFLGNNFPRLKLVTILYCMISSLLRSFGPCSRVPKPTVLFFPVAESVAKSAKLESTFSTAAIPPLLSMSAIRSSLNQTSPSICRAEVVPNVLFLIPTIKVLTNPKFGFPLTPILDPFSEIVKISPGACGPC